MKPIVILGPTASGKSDAAMAAAQANGNTHIVVCDAMQVYKRMDIGTAKPTTDDQQLVNHHCIDLVEPSARFTVSDYQKDARAAVAKVHELGANVLVVGAGDMGAGIAKALAGAGAKHVTVMNRSVERAEELAQSVGAVVGKFDQLSSAVAHADVILTCTGAGEVIMSRSFVDAARAQADNKQLLIVDIAMPRDVEHSVGELAGVTLRDLHDLRDWAQAGIDARQQEANQVRQIIGEEVQRFTQESISRQAAPLVAELHERAESIRRAELERFSSKLGALTPEQRDAVEALSKAVVAKLLHSPSVQLKNSAGTPQGERIAAALRDLFDIE